MTSIERIPDSSAGDLSPSFASSRPKAAKRPMSEAQKTALLKARAVRAEKTKARKATESVVSNPAPPPATGGTAGQDQTDVEVVAPAAKVESGHEPVVVNTVDDRKQVAAPKPKPKKKRQFKQKENPVVPKSGSDTKSKAKPVKKESRREETEDSSSDSDGYSGGEEDYRAKKSAPSRYKIDFF
jgi:hypothetical protein